MAINLIYTYIIIVTITINTNVMSLLTTQKEVKKTRFGLGFFLSYFLPRLSMRRL